jgi:hypothetical protein
MKPLNTSFKSKIVTVKLKPTLKSTTKMSDHKINSSSCQWVCNTNCPFGYKKDFKTNCYKCECIDMILSECGVPCWNEVIFVN